LKRAVTSLAAIAVVLAATSGAFAAHKYLITSPAQVKPGTISYGNLSAAARHRLEGQDGSPGATGPQGPKGDTGVAGVAGVAGVKGDTGPQGPAGQTGPQGSKGDPGAAGPTGPAGAPGVDGADGVDGAVGPAGPPGADGTNGLAKASGLVAWTADPAQILQSATDSNGSIHGGSVSLEQGQVITSLAELVATAGVAMTHGMFAIYDKNLNLVAQTADTPAAFQVTNQWVELPLTAPYTVPATDRYYFADLLAAATTMPSIGNIGSLAATSARNILPGAFPRGISGSGAPFAAFPATLANNGTGITRCIVAR
jgi:hypothetical protein